MRFVIQRVCSASVTVEENIVGKIEKGFLVFVGISQTDNEQVADKMVRKLIGLRIFEDTEGKTNLDIKTVSGSLFMVSQFTLYADCKKGNRPSFIHAGVPDKAKALYEYILQLCKEEIPLVEKGIFGADMKVSLTNDGPFTVILDSNEMGIFP